MPAGVPEFSTQLVVVSIWPWGLRSQAGGPRYSPRARLRSAEEAHGSFTVPRAGDWVGPSGPETSGLQLPTPVDCQ